jgi:hypothetical protein
MMRYWYRLMSFFIPSKKKLSVDHEAIFLPLAVDHHASQTCDHAVSPLRGQRCGNQTVLDWDSEVNAEAIQIQAVAQSVPLLLLYAAMHCRGAVAPLWTVVPIVCDELQVSIGLAAKQNI